MDEAARLVGNVARLRLQTRLAGHYSGFICRDAFTAALLVVNRSGKMPVYGLVATVFSRDARLVVNRIGPLERFYRRLVEAGKPKQVALIAVARKLLLALNEMMRSHQPWRSASAPILP